VERVPREHGVFPSTKDFMINCRAENIERLVERLRNEGEEYDNRAFAHLPDPEGNTTELWGPVDRTLTKISEGRSTH
jgi:hypothetical protein